MLTNPYLNPHKADHTLNTLTFQYQHSPSTASTAMVGVVAHGWPGQFKEAIIIVKEVRAILYTCSCGMAPGN